MNRHTPGPWKKDKDDWLLGADGELVCVGDLIIGFGDGKDAAVSAANTKLILAAPELLFAQTMGVELNTPDFLDWIADRLVYVHGERPEVDYVLSLRERAKAGRSAIHKASSHE